MVKRKGKRRTGEPFLWGVQALVAAGSPDICFGLVLLPSQSSFSETGHLVDPLLPHVHGLGLFPAK